MPNPNRFVTYQHGPSLRDRLSSFTGDEVFSHKEYRGTVRAILDSNLPPLLKREMASHGQSIHQILLDEGLKANEILALGPGTVVFKDSARGKLRYQEIDYIDEKARKKIERQWRKQRAREFCNKFIKNNKKLSDEGGFMIEVLADGAEFCMDGTYKTTRVYEKYGEVIIEQEPVDNLPKSYQGEPREWHYPIVDLEKEDSIPRLIKKGTRGEI